MSITTDDINEAFIIFETLNARGKELESSDLLKNYIFMQAGSNIENVKSKWLQMIDTLDKKEDATKLIRYYWNARNDFVREKNLYNTVRDYIKLSTCENFVSDLIEMADLYNTLTNPDDNKYFNDETIQDHLSHLNIMNTSTFYPIIMAMVLNDIYSEKDIQRVVKALEVLAFRNFIVAKFSANKYEVSFANIAKNIYNNSLSTDNIISLITEDTIDDEKFKRYLIGFTVKSVKVSKFILREIEDYDSNEKKTNKNNKTINLEHIMPKKINLWQIDKDDHEKYLYRLSNQTLLLEEYNKSISNKTFDKKKEMYKKSNIKMTQLLCQYDKWTISEIQEREDYLNQKILEIWSLQN